MEQSTEFNVKVKRGGGWRNYSTARFQISVGQEYHEDEKLKAAFDWATQRFDKVIVCVNDVLQRFNLQGQGLSPEDAYKQAEEEGSKWIERNLSELQQVGAVIYRWEDWTENPRFSLEFESLKTQYLHDASFRNEVDTEVVSFWERRKDQISVDFDRFKELSTEYLLEEIAVFNLMFEKEAAVDIYPGSTLLPCRLRQQENLGKDGFTRIKFSEKIQHPQVA